MHTIDRTATAVLLKRLLITFLVTMAARPVWSQSAAAPTPESVLASGMTAWITDASGREHKARILSVSTGLVTASVGREVRGFRAPDIARVRVRRNDSLLNGALIGAGAAIGTGLFLCTRTEPWRNCRDDAGPIVQIGAVGAGIGLAVDAFLRWRHTIYEDRTRLRLDAAPLIASDVAGARVSFSF